MQQTAIPTWTSHVDVHAVALELSLRRRQCHGGGHADVGGRQVMLSPLPAVHCVFTVRQQTGLLHLRRKQEVRFIGCVLNTDWWKIQKHKRDRQNPTDLHPFGLGAVGVQPLVTVVTKKRFLHRLGHVSESGGKEFMKGQRRTSRTSNLLQSNPLLLFITTDC